MKMLFLKISPLKMSSLKISSLKMCPNISPWPPLHIFCMHFGKTWSVILPLFESFLQSLIFPVGRIVLLVTFLVWVVLLHL